MSYRLAAQSDRRRKLTNEEWEALKIRIETDDSKTVEEHCRDADVTRGRYYQRYPVNSKAEVEGGEASDHRAPTGSDPGNTAQ